MTTEQIIDESDPTPACMGNTDCPSGVCMNGTCTQRTVQQRWGNVSCLDGEIEKHDGRIRPVFE